MTKSEMQRKIEELERQLRSKSNTGEPTNCEITVKGSKALIEIDLTEAVPDSAWDNGWTVGQTGPFIPTKKRHAYTKVAETEKHTFLLTGKLIAVKK